MHIDRKTMTGELVSDQDMHPQTNIWGRKWLAENDLHGTYRGHWPTPDGAKPQGLFWVFPPTDNE